MVTRRKKVSFTATRIKKVPVKVNFRRSDGTKISFKATKAVKVPKKVTFYAKRRKK